MSNVRQSFSAFVLNNQRKLYWLYTASILIMVANWFLPTHGFFEFEHPLLRNLLVDLGLFAPTIAILALGSQNCRNYLPQVAVCVFVSMLFQWHFVTISCFVLLVFAWTKPNNTVALLFLLTLQSVALLVMFSVFMKPCLYTNLSSVSLPLSGKTVTLQQERNGSEGLFDSDYSVNVFFNIAGGLRLVKSYYTFNDEYGDCNPNGFSLEAANGNLDAVYFVSDQDSNAPLRRLVSLKKINNYSTHYIRDDETLSPSSP